MDARRREHEELRAQLELKTKECDLNNEQNEWLTRTIDKQQARMQALQSEQELLSKRLEESRGNTRIRSMMER